MLGPEVRYSLGERLTCLGVASLYGVESPPCNGQRLLDSTAGLCDLGAQARDLTRN